MNTRILHVFGPENATMDYEDKVKERIIVPEELWEESWKAGNSMWSEDNSFSYEAHKFGEVDPRFIELASNLLYASGDSKNIYKIGD